MTRWCDKGPKNEKPREQSRGFFARPISEVAAAYLTNYRIASYTAASISSAL
jgi:hypothetical protein